MNKLQQDHIMSIYILSSPDNVNGYKIGLHSGTLTTLRSRYITALPNLIIHLYFPMPNAAAIERQFHKDNKHLPHIGEWYKISLKNAIMLVINYIHEGVCDVDNISELLAKYGNNACRTAARRGSIKLLKAFHQTNAPWDELVTEAAALAGSLECLTYAHEHGCSWDIRALQAAFISDIECFKYMMNFYLWTITELYMLESEDNTPTENLELLAATLQFPDNIYKSRISANADDISLAL